jgi:predicted CXXCH cytochrome family protein
LARKRRKSGVKGGSNKTPPRERAALPSQHQLQETSDTARFPKRHAFAAISAVGLISALVAAFLFVNSGPLTPKVQSADTATFVGSQTCAGCHQAEAKLWDSSQHRAAMQHATDKTVLGDFNDARLDHYGVHSRFFRKDTKFFVETDGPDGKLAVFEVKYTFGVDPLQQYLVEFQDGRLQVLALAWDSRPQDKGGQRWFHIYPSEDIRHDDVLHWTKLNQNWNFMCAECHSTGVRKNYDANTSRFATTWAEISVGCETCHGQGSRHVAWAQQRESWWPFGQGEDSSKGLKVRFDERNGVAWPSDSKSVALRRSVAPATLRKEVETCGLCHARRAAFHDGWVPGQWLSQTHLVEPLARNTYHPDGQIRDVEEPYNYTPFKQSRMFAAGVTCSDCHEPHSAKLRSPGEGVCMQCHASDKYANAGHHHHAGVAPPPTCMSCHMQTRTYMVIDTRHDHSFRVPRPDLSIVQGTPNACNDCHRDKAAQWAAAAIAGWFAHNREGFQSYGPAFHAARTGQSDAAALLGVIAADRNAPAVARASALSELAGYVSSASIAAARAGLTDADPMVRIGALDMLENLPAGQIWPLASPLLSDPVRGVRIRAASLLAAVPTAHQPQADRARFDEAAKEFVAAQRFNADRPEARTSLGHFLAQRGETAEAESEYKAALRLSPQYAAAAINLADLYRQTGRDSEGEAVLRTAAAASPRDAAIQHAMGLTLTRLKRPGEAIAAFQRATELGPDVAQYAYVYGVALHSGGRPIEGIAVLQEALQKHPANREILSALISFNRIAGNTTAALDFAERLALVTPDDQSLAALVRELRQSSKSPVR